MSHWVFCGGVSYGKGIPKQGGYQFSDFSAFSPHSRPASIRFLRLDTSCGLINENFIHSPFERIKTSFLSLIYLYFMITVLSIMFSFISSSNASLKFLMHPSFAYLNLNYGLPNSCWAHIKTGYICLLSAIFLKSVCLSHDRSKIYNLCKLGSSRFCKILTYILLFILLFNFLLIGIVNPSLLNPGPNSLNVCYQNVQGLIPFSNLGKNQPCLDQTKIYKLNAYIHINKPDVLLLNET